MANTFFPEVKGKLGFGCMRLPLAGTVLGDGEFKRMTDAFMKAGFNYFDTAHGYLVGQSEKALRRCLTSRYPRESFVLTNKLTEDYFRKEEDIRPFFENQLRWCGVEYFDFYLMHAQGSVNFEKFRRCRAYETAFRLKEEGLVRHVGISFHDTPEYLDKILTEYPQIECVQIQLNYLDYDSPAIQSRRVYEVCVKHNKPVMVMEPVKGGTLANLPAEAMALLDPDKSPASYAIRFAAGFDNVFMVLSGMSNLHQMEDNAGFMRSFEPLSPEEREVLDKIIGIYRGMDMIPCTACRYCVEGCPKNILIPDIFACYNQKKIHRSWNQNMYYRNVITLNNGKASDCIRCGKCEHSCPQHLKIRDLLKDAAREFE
ncbi:MAG: aldo/keto reductase [Oscillospiraceae bacterium]|nr:aldo/keto reductase [Oscillospiraceae bacterium]